MELPPKANGRPGFHESTIFLLRQGMVAGTTFAAIPCPVLPAMPRLLGIVAENIVRSIKDEKIRRYTKMDLKKILTEAIEAGRLDKNDLNEYLRSKL